MLQARSFGSYDTDEVSFDTGLACLEPSLTVQSEKEQTDINWILERFAVTGQLPQGVRVPTYEDFLEGVFDYRSAVEAMELAEDSFMAMPAKVRAEFENDPQRFLEFCSNPANLPRMRELGLAVPEKAPEPEKVMKVEVVSSTAPAKPAQSGSGGNPQ